MERRFPGLAEVKAKVAGALHALENRFAPRTKYELELSDEFDALLGRLAWRKGIKKEEVIRNAVASYAYLQKELKSDEATGEKHLVIRNDTEILQRIELP